jgi:simple sugar transport system permease protein
MMAVSRLRPAAKGVVPYIFPGISVTACIVCSYWMSPVVTVAVLSSALRQSTPLVLGALCGLLSERSGVMNIGIEGQMLMAAFWGFLMHVWTGSLLMGVLSGLAAGAFAGFLFAWMSVSMKMDQIIGGTIINILAVGLTGFFYPAGMSAAGKLKIYSIPLLSEIPLVGPVLFRMSPIVFLSICLVLLVHYCLFYTRWGLRTRAMGEHPKAAAAMGISVVKIRYGNIIIGGCIAGLAGAFLSLESVGVFERGMTNGRGFIALAVMIFGKWTPIGAWGAALLFGLSMSFQTQLQFDQVLSIPHQFTGMLPYLITIIVLAIFIRRNRPPASLGVPYERE